MIWPLIADRVVLEPACIVSKKRIYSWCCRSLHTHMSIQLIHRGVCLPLHVGQGRSENTRSGTGFRKVIK